MLAAQNGKANIVSHLLDQGADPTLRTKVGGSCTPTVLVLMWLNETCVVAGPERLQRIALRGARRVRGGGAAPAERRSGCQPL